MKKTKTIVYTRKQISKRGWRKIKPEKCIWNDDDGWQSACGDSFWFEDGGPRENGFKFCPYCGKELVEK